jgi:DNA-binding NtrC family response regulator
VGWQVEKSSAATLDTRLKGLPYKTAKDKNLLHFNHAYIGHVLAECQGNVSQAARLCGLERQALQQIMRRYGIRAEVFRT